MMRIEIRDTSVPISDPLREHILRKLGFALRRLSDRVDHVVVRLVDLNGPKGGRDKRCRLVARLSPPESVVVEATDADAYVAVSQAAIRLDERITRLLGRRRPKPGAARFASSRQRQDSPPPAEA